MSKPQINRVVNKNIFYSKLKLHGLTLEKLGKQLDPPVSKVRVCQYLKAGGPSHRLHEMSKILGSNVATLFPIKDNDDKAA